MPARPTTRLPALAAIVASLLLLVSCSSQDAARSTLRVFAAASLSVAGDELQEAYSQEHEGQSIEWNFAGSSALVRQIEQGSPADVFISADEKNMRDALQLPEFAGVADRDEPRVVATNQLVLAIAEGNPANIRSLKDLGGGARVAICAPEVPCGSLAHEALEGHGAPIRLSNPSEEANVSNVATKVATGQVDAGFVYASDAAAMQQQGKKITTLPVEHVAANKYPAASTNAPAEATNGSDNSDTEPAADSSAPASPATGFIRWLASPTAQRILADHGFGPADPGDTSGTRAAGAPEATQTPQDTPK